jgi:hypothetical protein
MTDQHDKPITQHEFLVAAMTELNLNREQFAIRIGCPWDTFKKWIAPPDSANNYREMPTVAWSLVREVLAHERLKKIVAPTQTLTQSNNRGAAAPASKARRNIVTQEH